MASRIGTLTNFAPLSPPWQLPALDTNSGNIVAAFNDSSLGYVNAIATDNGTANNYLVTLPYGSPLGYNQGMTVVFIPANSNTGSSSITVSPLGSVSILTTLGGALPANAIIAGSVVQLVYIGSAFRIINQNVYNPNLVNPTTLSPGTLITNMSGFTQMYGYMVQSTAGTYTYNFTNVAVGTAFYMLVQTNGSTRGAKMTATTAAAATINCFALEPNGTIVNLATQTLTTPNLLLLQGVVTFDQNTVAYNLYMGLFSN